MPAMLHVALQEGFVDDAVSVHVGGAEVYRKDAVRTDVRIGLADSLEIESRAGPVRIDVALPAKGIRGSVTLAVETTIFLGVSVEQAELRFTVSDQPFGYV